MTIVNMRAILLSVLFACGSMSASWFSALRSIGNSIYPVLIKNRQAALVATACVGGIIGLGFCLKKIVPMYRRYKENRERQEREHEQQLQTAFHDYVARFKEIVAWGSIFKTLNKLDNKMKEDVMQKTVRECLAERKGIAASQAGQLELDTFFASHEYEEFLYRFLENRSGRYLLKSAFAASKYRAEPVYGENFTGAVRIYDGTRFVREEVVDVKSYANLLFDADAVLACTEPSEDREREVQRRARRQAEEMERVARREAAEQERRAKREAIEQERRAKKEAMEQECLAKRQAVNGKSLARR